MVEEVISGLQNMMAKMTGGVGAVPTRPLSVAMTIRGLFKWVVERCGSI